MDLHRTKVVATYGPAIASTEKIRKLARAGVSVFRINCSHGDTEDFREAARTIREATADEKYPIGILFDIAGPKLRLARFDGQLQIKRGQKIHLVRGKTSLRDSRIGVNHPAVIESVRKGQRLFIDDGALIFEIQKAGKQEVVVRAANSGVILPGKGINLPDTDIGIPTLSAKDKRDIGTAVECDADFIALSFVRKPDDIKQARRLIKRHGGQQILIAKLEKREAIEQLEDILELADGVMVARGDLGVELPPQEVPTIQKRIINLANRYHKPVIVATQMLESMRFNPRPTRAEVSDVAAAVFDYADAVMLSAETATGKYPVETVQTMRRVIMTTEAAQEPQIVDVTQYKVGATTSFAIAGAVSNTERYCRARVIYAFTTSGFTAGLISNLFPPQPVMALTPDAAVMRRLTLFRSVWPIQITQPKSFEDMLETVDTVSRQRKLAKKGDTVIITGGAPFGSTVPTNFMMFHEVK